jgi:hypothetical protein
MADFYYPLPPEKLKRRYSPLFEIVRKRQSGSFIGLPESAKSGYLQFLLQEKKIVRSLLPDFGEKYKVMYFEPIPIINANPYHWLFQLSIQLEIVESEYKHVQTEDPIILITNIQKYLLKLAEDKKHLAIFIGKLEVFSDLSIESGKALRSFWEIKRQPPFNPLSLIFLSHSRSPQFENYPKFFDSLATAMNENHIYFPSLDKDETSYTVDRFCSYFDLNIDNSIKSYIYKLSGGIYPLILNSIKLLKDIKLKVTKTLVRSFSANKLIRDELLNLWESFDSRQKAEMSKYAKGIPVKSELSSTIKSLGLIDDKGYVKSVWLQSFIQNQRFREVTPKGDVFLENVLKGKELLVYKYLFSQKGEVVSREKIAKVLWGEDYREKYSDWAIDKVISRIRKKLTEHDAVASLVTIRGQGYTLLT